MEVLVAKLKKTKTSRKLLAGNYCSDAVAVATWQHVIGWNISCARVLTVYRGKRRRRWRSSGDSPARGK